MSEIRSSKANAPDSLTDDVVETSGRKKRRSFIWQPFLIGTLAFFLMTGGDILRPANLGWLMNGDRGMNLLGWMFFRNGPLLQQPFGKNWQEGMDTSSSTVYTDSVSLMAFLFKPFSAWLPEHFQYFGLWTLLCFLLQSFFAWKLLDRLTGDAWIKAFGTLFFVLAPPFLNRIYPHLMLGAHWLVLASLYLYFYPRFRSLPWIVLLLVASLVTPILLAMTLLVFAAALAKHCVNGQLTVLEAINNLAIAMPLLVFVMWEAGYFTVSSVGTGGFGYFRTSLLGFLDPGSNDGSPWSYLLRDQPKAPGNGEGNCFLGLGMVLLSIVAGGQVLRSGAGSIEWRKLWPILLVFSFCVVFALSNNVAIGPYIIFHYEVPSIVEKLISPFRASGRFIWLAYYLLIIGILALVLKSFGRRTSLALISFCLLVQVADSWQALLGNRAKYKHRFHLASLSSPFWQRAADRYDKIAYVLPCNNYENMPLCFFAATRHLPINIGIWARVDEQKLETARAKVSQVISHGELDPRTLYVFQGVGLWGTSVLRMSAGDWAGVVDGLNIIAPAWEGEQRQDAMTAIRQAIPEYHFGTRLLFVPGAEGTKYLGYGWSQPELSGGIWPDGDSGSILLSGGVWSDGDGGSILLLLDHEPASDVYLRLEGHGFIHAKCPEQHVDVSVNSTAIGEIIYSQQNPGGSQSIRVPRVLLLGRHGIVEIQFQFRNDISPARLGLSEDLRKVAFFLEGLTVNPVESSPSPSPISAVR